jgi:peptide/nickel transport system permease protein
VLKYVAQRIGWMALSVLVIISVSFMLTRLAPGDPVTAIVGEYPVPDAYRTEIITKFGLDKPIWEQFGLYLAQLVQGNMGFSFANSSPVAELLIQRTGATMMLMIPALMLSAALGIVLGTFAASRVGTFRDSFVSGFVIITDSVPVFWVGQLALLLFAVSLRVLPVSGMNSVRGGGGFGDLLMHMVLPVLTLTLAYCATVARVTRTSVAESMTQDYILTARAKGQTGGQLLRRQALPNAAIPVLTVVGYQFAFILTGAILTETVFGWPGIGSLFVGAISERDYPVVQGVFLFAAIVVVVANFITDLAYSVADPRIRTGLLNG